MLSFYMMLTLPPKNPQKTKQIPLNCGPEKNTCLSYAQYTVNMNSVIYIHMLVQIQNLLLVISSHCPSCCPGPSEWSLTCEWWCFGLPFWSKRHGRCTGHWPRDPRMNTECLQWEQGSVSEELKRRISKRRCIGYTLGVCQLNFFSLFIYLLILFFLLIV